MRIITGKARGRKLKAPLGEETRPTTDRIKESMFNILQFHLEGRRVLDLYAGSGQLGLEALSRGAAECIFVDTGAAALAAIRDNLSHTGLPGGKVIAGDALRFLEGTDEPFDIVLLDPPYGKGLVEKTVETLARRDLVRPGGLILAERAAKDPVYTPPKPYVLQKTYPYGGKALVLYSREGDIT